jgi:hypothetical protein
MALERGGVSPEGASGPRARRGFGGTALAAEVARAVGSCHQAVIAWGVIYNLWVHLCFYYLQKKMGFPRLSGDPYDCPRQHQTVCVAALVNCLPNANPDRRSDQATSLFNLSIMMLTSVVALHVQVVLWREKKASAWSRVLDQWSPWQACL